MKIKVYLTAFQKGTVREVEVPDEGWNKTPINDKLSTVFHYGQNDFQPEDKCSVSAGDIIEFSYFDGKEYFIVKPVGFKRLTKDDLIELLCFGLENQSLSLFSYQKEFKKAYQNE